MHSSDIRRRHHNWIAHQEAGATSIHHNHIGRILRDHSGDFVVPDRIAGKVIACNTATAAAAEAIRAASRLPIVALEPGVKPAAVLTRTGVIGVLATTRTLESERFERLVGNHANHLMVVAQACPGLAEAIESEGPGSLAVAAMLDTFVAPLAAANADVVVLGCTHYPWVAEAIAERMPAGVTLLDTGEPVARQLERLLAAGGLLGGGQGRLTVATSGAPLAVTATVDRLFGEKMHVEHWEP